MEQIQEAIKKDIIKHAWRDIVIVYEPGKTSGTEEDEQLLAAYIKLHDYEKNLKDTAKKLFNEYIPINKRTEVIRDQFTTVKATFNKSVELADKLSAAAYILRQNDLIELENSQMKANDEIQEQHHAIENLYKDILLLDKELNEYHVAAEEGQDALYDEYKNIFYSHSKNYEINSIDIVAFDREYDNFCSYRTVHEDHREGLIDYCIKTVDDYNKLNMEVTVLYAAWAEFVKRCNLLQTIASNAGMDGSNNN